MLIRMYGSYSYNVSSSKKLHQSPTPAFRAVKPKAVPLKQGNEGLAVLQDMLETKRNQVFESIGKYISDFVENNPNITAFIPAAAAVTMTTAKEEGNDTSITLYTDMDKTTELFLQNPGKKKPLRVAKDGMLVANMDVQATRNSIRAGVTDVCTAYEENLGYRTAQSFPSLEERYNELKKRNDILRKNLAEYENMTKDELVNTLEAVFNTASEMLFAKYRDDYELERNERIPACRIKDKESGYTISTNDFDFDLYSAYYTLEFDQKGLGHVEIKSFRASHLDDLTTIEVTNGKKKVLKSKHHDGFNNTFVMQSASYGM